MDNSLLVTISPNPAVNYIIVDGAEQFKQLIITDMNGKTMKLMNNPDTSQRIDVSNLLTGIYFIRLIKDDEVVTAKFIKQ